ncbi:hypothetical protein LIT25_12835 [Bacillus sp. F19]|nr:hypothetical protein LIT25_12835 [Bacillus sp. F19]
MNNYQYGYYPNNWPQEEPFENREDAIDNMDIEEDSDGTADAVFPFTYLSIHSIINS